MFTISVDVRHWFLVDGVLEGLHQRAGCVWNIWTSCTKSKVKVVRHEGVLGVGGIDPHILDLDTRWR